LAKATSKRRALSPNADALWQAHAGSGYVTLAKVSATLRTAEPVILEKAWNELRDARLAWGDLLRGERCKVLKRPGDR
jgi:hypothetical protein